MNILKSIWNMILYIIHNGIFSKKLKISPKCLIGKTVIVTGGCSGIGYAAATTLASRGCKLILADCQNGEEAKSKIIAVTGNQNVVYKHFDLSSIQSVRKFAADICKTEDKIDILLNNAAVGIARELVSEDGLNYHMHVNVFGPFLLTHLLKEPLKNAKSARVFFIGSFLTLVNDLSLENLNVTDYEMTDDYKRSLYSNSKTCCILMAQEFAKKLGKYGITVNSLDPTSVITPMIKYTFENYGNFFENSVMKILVALYSKDADEVANHYLSVMTREDPEKTNGKYFVLSKTYRKPSPLENEKFCQAAWSKIEELVGLKPEERISS